MKGEDFPAGEVTGAKGASGGADKPVHKSRGRLVDKIEPGEKLIWRNVDGIWSKYLVDASVQV